MSFYMWRANGKAHRHSAHPLCANVKSPLYVNFNKNLMFCVKLNNRFSFGFNQKFSAIFGWDLILSEFHVLFRNCYIACDALHLCGTIEEIGIEGARRINTLSHCNVCWYDENNSQENWLNQFDVRVCVCLCERARRKETSYFISSHRMVTTVLTMKQRYKIPYQMQIFCCWASEKSCLKC